MSRLAVFLILVGVVVAGLLRLIGRRLQWKKKKTFAEKYLSRFRQVAAAEAVDPALYNWLVFHSAGMQARLGLLGVSADAATPYDPFPTPIDPLLVNTLPEIREGIARPDRIARCEDALIRYLGTLDEARATYHKQLANPVSWLGAGVRGVLLLPFLVLQWLGLFKEPFVSRLAERAWFRFLSALVALVGTTASIMILVQGWDGFTQHVAQWIGGLLP